MKAAWLLEGLTPSLQQKHIEAASIRSSNKNALTIS
jgi:hypothetical protein